MALLQSQIKLEGKHFLISIPGKTYKGRNRILMEYLPVQRIAFKPIKPRHIFQKDKSIGFNSDLINSFGVPYFDLVYIEYRGRYLWTSRQAILRYGICRSFDNKKLEPQIFFKIDLFKASREDAIQEIQLINEILSNETKQELKQVPGEIDMFESKEPV